jgi:spore germination protein GerM
VRRAAVLVIAALLASCRGQTVTLVSESDLPEDVYGSPIPTPTRTVDLPEEGTVYLVREGHLVKRTLPLQGGTESLPAALLVALFTAPVDEEAKAHTEIPTGTTLNAVSVADRVAIVDVSGAFDVGGPDRSLALRVAQVVYTLTERGTDITFVEFHIDGVRRSVTGPGGASLLEPVTRADFAQLAPPRD